MKRRFTVLLLLLAAACDTGMDCGDGGAPPGPDVESGVFDLQELYAYPSSMPVDGLPYADAEDFKIELSADRSTAMFTYVRDGVSIKETWSVRIIEHG
jgi:hypothetical protein